jgi:2-haloacid dehalogenase
MANWQGSGHRERDLAKRTENPQAAAVVVFFSLRRLHSHDAHE